MKKLKAKIKHIIEENTSRSGRIFDMVVVILILVSIIIFSIETLPRLTEHQHYLLHLINEITMMVFVAEYVLRIWVSDNKTKYIFSFYGLIDLLAIVPFFATANLDLRALRAMRFFRLARAFKLARYSRAMKRLSIALNLVKEELVLFFTLTVILIYTAAVAIFYFENETQPEKFSSVFDSLWWAVATLSTVGYGDMYPVTAGGKICTFFILMIGLCIVAMPAALIGSALTQVESREHELKIAAQLAHEAGSEDGTQGNTHSS